MRFWASAVAEATGGHLVGPDVELDGASFDSRTLRPGQLFVPLVAERDGHEFIAAAVAAGAPAYLTAAGPSPADGASAIVVRDTAAALMDLGRWARGRLPDRVVGVTGSVGKTTVKDLASAALRAALAHRRQPALLQQRAGPARHHPRGGRRHRGPRPRDGDAGLGPDRRAVRGRPARRSAWSRSVAAAHTELLGGIDGVAQAKGELIESLPSSGVAVLNADDPRVATMAARTSARVITYGSGGADVAVREVTLDEHARARFIVDTPCGRIDLALAVPGAHMAVNAAAALAVALACDVALADAAAAVAGANVSPWRMELRRAPSGALVLNDAYNANPTSMRAALDTLSALPARRRVAVLGLMAELDDPGPEHRAIAVEARDRGIELIPVGTDLYGPPPAQDPVEALGPLGEGDAVLVKGSRVAGLEALAARLLEG